jgi:hypothetical protein
MPRPTSARTWRALPILLVAVALGIAASAAAQIDVTTGRISGFARTKDGGALPGVNVTATNKDTGLTKSVATDKNGFYQVLSLPTGNYRLDANLQGFAPISAEQVRLNLGSSPTVDFTMAPARVTEAVTVSASASTIEVTNTTVGTTIQTEQLKNLPVSGRDFKNLVLLTPATSIESQRNYIQVSGQRAINTNVTVDGVDYNDPFFGGNVGSAEGRAPLSISEESVKEFTVITNGASVEFGRSGGGFVNVVTKSGTNTLHGSGFFYWQPQALIANFASTAAFPNGRAVPDQDKKQYGASLGGPLMKDKLFFFGSFDKQKQTQTVLINQSVINPTPDIFAKWPVLDGPDNYIQGRDGWVAFGRFDWQALDTQRLQARVNYADYTGANGTNSSANDTLQHNGIEQMKSLSMLGTYSSQFGASTLNDFNFNYVHESVPRQDKGLNLPEIRVGSARYGEVSFLPIVSTSKRYEVADTFTYLLQNHVFKAGGDYNDTSVVQTFKGNWRGIFFFNNNADLIAGKYFQYAQFGGLSGLTADEAGTVSFGQKEYAGFVQDQWFVNEKLTVTAGVRYEFLNNPNAPVLNPNSKAASGQFALNTTVPDVKNQWSPRVSLSYAPDSKTAIRLTAGRFWSRTPALLWSQLYSSNGLKGVQYSSRTNTGGQDPTNPACTFGGSSCYDSRAPGWGANWVPQGVERIDLSSIPAGTAGLPAFAVDPNFTNPHTDRITLGFEREIMPQVTTAINLTYAKGYNLERLTDANRAYDGTISANGQPHYSSVRPNAFYSTITEYISDAKSKYYDITMVTQKRFANNFSAGVTATYSQDRDNDSNERNFSGIQAEDFNHLNTAYSWADRDRRWRASANAVWSKAVTSWWNVGLAGSLRFQTGTPFSPGTSFDFNNDGQSGTDRPTLGCTSIGGSATNYDCSNGTHLKRNSYRQPSTYAFDVRLSNGIRLGPGEFNVAVDCFNCTNAGNKFISSTTFGRVPGPTVGNTSVPNTSKPNAGFANANNPGTPRTIQISGRYDF